MDNLNKKTIKKSKSNVLNILNSKKALLNKMKKNFKNTESKFLKSIKERACFKEQDWYGFENKDWKLTNEWAIDALNNFNEYWGEENTAHDQWYLAWYENAINDINSFIEKNNEVTIEKIDKLNIEKSIWEENWLVNIIWANNEIKEYSDNLINILSDEINWEPKYDRHCIFSIDEDTNEFEIVGKYDDNHPNFENIILSHSSLTSSEKEKNDTEIAKIFIDKLNIIL